MRESLAATWLYKMLLDCLREGALDGPCLIAASAALAELETPLDAESEPSGIVKRIRDQVHWVEDPDAKKRLIESLLRLRWCAESELSHDETLLDEYSRSLAATEFSVERAQEALSHFAALGLPIEEIARHLHMHLDEEVAVGLTAGVGIELCLRADWAAMPELGSRIVRRAQALARSDLLMHVLAFASVQWREFLTIAGHLTCCTSQEAAEDYAREAWRPWLVDLGVLEKRESDSLRDYFSESREEPQNMRRRTAEKLALVKKLTGDAEVLSWFLAVPPP